MLLVFLNKDHVFEEELSNKKFVVADTADFAAWLFALVI
jgi:hypothetical protein